MSKNTKLITISLIAVTALFGAGCERKGDIKVSDCRETVFLESDNIEKYLHSFTCSNGYCARVLTNKNGGCETAFVYFTETEKDPTGVFVK